MSIALGQCMFEARMKAELTLRALGKKIDMGASYLCDIEKGRRTPPPETIKRICEATGANPSRPLWLWILEHIDEGEAIDAIRNGVKFHRTASEDGPQ